MPNTSNTDSLKNKAAKGFLWGGLSNALQQVFALAFGIILGRILDPEDMGLVGLLTIFSAIASALTESGFVSALSIRKSIAHKDYNAVFWFSIAVGAAIYSLLYLSAPAIAAFFELPQLETLARVSFLNFFISSFGVAHHAYLNRNLRIREKSISTSLAVMLSGIMGAIAAIYGLAYWALVIQNLAYCLIVVIGFSYFSGFRPSFKLDFSPIRSLLAYSSKLVVTNIFVNLNNNFLTTILGKYYTQPADSSSNSVAVAGQYNQANKWNLMGQTLILNISNSIIQPLMTEVAEDSERRTRVFRKILSFISFITFPLLFGLALVAPDFIVITVGPKWLESADYLRIIAFGGAFAVVSNAFSNFILSRGRSTTYMWNIIAFGLLQIALFFILKGYGLIVLLTTYSILHILWLNTWYFICKDLLGYNYRFLFKDVYLYAATALIGYLLTYIWIDQVPNVYLRLAASIVSMGTIYLGLCLLHSRDIFLEIRNFLLKKRS